MTDTVAFFVVVVPPTQLGVNPLCDGPLSVGQLRVTPILQGLVDLDPGANIGVLEAILFERYKAHQPAYSWIYKPNQAGQMSPKTLKTLLTQQSLDDFAEEVVSATPIYEVFDLPDEQQSLPRHTFIVVLTSAPHVVQAPPPANEADVRNDEARDDVPEIVSSLNKDRKNHKKAVLEGKTPSVNARSTEYKKTQHTSNALLDGRLAPEYDAPTTTAPPVELYNPVFASFKARANDLTLDVPDDICRLTAKLFRELAVISVQDEPRDASSRETLAKILNVGLETIESQDNTKTDFMSTRLSYGQCNAAPVIFEVKAELASGGSDPSVQVSFSYRRFWCEKDRASIADICCCPSFLLALAGPWLVILGAVNMQRTIVQRLSSYEWLGCSRVFDDAHVLRVAQILYALRLSVEELNTYYTTLTPPSASKDCVHPLVFPAFTSFTDDNGQEAHFEYVQPLEPESFQCVTFLARLLDGDRTGERIVVKFVDRYSTEAHNLLAGHDLAPRLIRHQVLGPIYGALAMVIMDYIEADSLAELELDYDDMKAIDATVRRALDLLGEEHLIFGDLRPQNVMLLDGKEPVEKRVRFIDFDWACKEGDGVRYPFHLSGAVRRASGAKDYDVITRAHQEAMFKMFWF
ncbi:hypothetical protein BDZ89DRAFT_1069246 [Hymenopellis radicata]|nr:hypothetical protein BDZ89DRAFT_1069246 [Hymenopellis radicata]